MVIPYITSDEIRQRLDKIPSTGAEGTAATLLLVGICMEVTDVVNLELGFAFEGYTAEEDEEERIIHSYTLPYLYLPPHEFGSVVSVVWGLDTTVLTDWQEIAGEGGLGGKLQRTSAAGYPYYPYANYYGWGAGSYTVIANWGYGEVPAAVKKVCLELAVNTWRARDKGLFTDIIGIEGQGGLRYIGGFTKEQQHILNRIKVKFGGGLVLA